MGFSRFILFLVACIACASAFAPVGGTIADKCPKLAAAIKAAGLDSALSGGPFTVFAPIDSAVSGDISADALKFHVATTQQLPTRNGKSYVTLCDDKEVGIKVTVDT